MVCEKCKKKLLKVIVPDKWKEGASNTIEGGGRKINENKLLSKKNIENEPRVPSPSSQTLTPPFSFITKPNRRGSPVLLQPSFSLIAKPAYFSSSIRLLSFNFFPTAVRLDSSAAGFACLSSYEAMDTTWITQPRNTQENNLLLLWLICKTMGLT
ncbi:hypothetical protein P8452_13595 [Trifolium repens]|nr:hypothetical protein P8452_13595 [Trifolium repens]